MRKRKGSGRCKVGERGDGVERKDCGICERRERDGVGDGDC